MTERDAFSELPELTSRICDADLSPGEVQQLESILRASAAARHSYYDFIELHGELLWTYGAAGSRAGASRGQALPAAESPAAAASGTGPAGLSPAPSGAVARPPAPQHPAGGGPSPVLGFSGALVDRTAIWLSSPRTLVLMVVTSLATYFVGLVISIAIERAREHHFASHEAGVATAPSSARIIAADGCRWKQFAPTLSGDLPAGPARSSLVEGCIEIEFAGGARVRVEGPAEFAASSGGRLELDRGRILAYVPRQARGFTVTTPTAEVIDLGTEFGVEVDGKGSTDLHVIRGRVEVKPAKAEPARRSDQPLAAVQYSEQLTAGEAVRVSAGGGGTERIAINANRFRNFKSTVGPATGAAANSRAALSLKTGGPIWLGNLFDDPPETPLADAIQTDAYKATPRAGATLGVERVIDASNPPPTQLSDSAGGVRPISCLEIAPGVVFDLADLGWQGGVWGSIANDAHANYGIGVTGSAISTRGTPMHIDDIARVEEGIGMHANSLLTLDLDKIRAAGGLEKQKLQFLCDRAGVNDDQMGERTIAAVHMAVLLSDRSGRVSNAIVNGRPIEVVEQAGVWSFAEPPGEPLRVDDKFASISLPIAADVKYLTLISASAGNGFHMDHAVWSGARLRVVQ